MHRHQNGRHGVDGGVLDPCLRDSRGEGLRGALVNARDVKNVPGRKTDVNDAQWLQQLHQHGLLRGTFRPRDEVVRLRAFLRHRERTVEYAGSHVQHMQKALMQMNVQLHHVVSDINGVTGMKIVRAIIAGSARQRNWLSTATFDAPLQRRPSVKRSLVTIVPSMSSL